MNKILIAGIGAGALVALGAVAPATASEDVAMLSVLHGVPDLTVDVYDAGADGFAFEAACAGAAVIKHGRLELFS